MVIDTETTDSDAGVRVISLGVVPWVGGQPRGAFEVFANPGCPIETTWVHGIADEDVADEPGFDTHLNALETALTPRKPTERVVVVAHNASSDIPALLAEFGRAGRTFPDITVADTMLLTRLLRPGTPAGLPDATAAFGLQLTNHHRALADAEDTARLLDRLLRLAAETGHTNLDHLLAATGPKNRVSAFTAASQSRSGPRRTTRFTFIDRPAEHAATHTKLPRHSGDTQLANWLDGVRECITLRCPLLLDRCRQLTTAHASVAAQLRDALREQLNSGTTADANTTLGALLGVLERRSGDRAEALVWFRQLEHLLDGHRRCSAEREAPFDACPACRAGAPCPADVWAASLADWTLARTNYRKHLHKWVGPDGYLATLAATEPVLATAQARAIAHNLVTSRDQGRIDPTEVLETAAGLGMTDARLAHLRARQLARAGCLVEAVAVCDSTLTARNGSTDPAWSDLTLARAGLHARKNRAEPVHPPRPFRPGRSAPANRPKRRRFTPWSEG